jgi:hypothetical protein
LIEYYATFSLSIDFPEMAGPGIVQLKRYIKKSSYVNFNKQVHGLIEKVMLKKMVKAAACDKARHSSKLDCFRWKLLPTSFKNSEH